MSECYRTVGVDVDRAVSQWRLIRHLVNDAAVSLSLLDVFSKLPTDFNDLRMLYRVALTIPVTTASVERGFSKLSSIKKKLHSKMLQDRLESSSVERDLLLQLSNDDLVVTSCTPAIQQTLHTLLI